MQDKIQEIMGLVDALSVECVSFGIGQVTCSEEYRVILGEDVKKARALLESKLRELVRVPLSDEKLRSIFDDLWPHGADAGIRKLFTATAFAIERAHGITSACGEV